MAVAGRVEEGLGEVGDVGQHDRVADETRLFELLLLLHVIAATDHGSAERHRVQEIVLGLDLNRFGADGPSRGGAGDEAQQEQGALDRAQLAEGPVKPAPAVAVPRPCSSMGGINRPAWVESTT